MEVKQVLDRMPRWDRFRPMILKFSFCISLLSCLALINIEGTPAEHTVPDYEVPEDMFTVSNKIFVLPEPKVVPPKLVPPPKPVIKPPPPVITKIKLVSNTVELPERIAPEPIEAPVLSPVTVAVNPEPVITKPEPKPEPPIMDFVERMPVYGDCDVDALSPTELKECSGNKILKYVYEHLKYPTLAREQGIEGTVVVQFVVYEDGTLDQIKVVREIGGGCGNAVTRVINGMGVWQPGLHRGQPVKVRYKIPVKFQLD